jgi:hypothetical protein
MTEPASYVEKHSALSPALVVLGIGVLFRNWPTGIRIDADGIQIGLVNRTWATPRWNLTVTHQAWGLFTCPWAAVDSVRVVTDRTELKDLGNPPNHTTLNNHWTKPRDQQHCMTGVLSPPFMRAALAIRLDLTTDGVHVPELRRATFYNSSTGQTELTPRPSWEWVAPTRHPDQVRAALARFQSHLPHRPPPTLP